MNVDMIDELVAFDKLSVSPRPWPRGTADALLDELFDLHRREVAA